MSKKQKGIICIILAAFSFALMNLFIRLAGDLPTYEKAFFRNVVAMLVSGTALFLSADKFKIGKGNFKFIMARAVGGTIGLLANFYAIDHLAISDASMLNKLSPFFSMVFSIWILKEKPKAKEWLILGIAFIGAIFVVKPSFSNVDLVPSLIGLLGGMSAGMAYTFVRKLGSRGERGQVIVFCFSTFSTIITIPFMLMDFVPMTGYQFLMLVLVGLSATAGQYSITAAYQFAAAKDISVFDYTQVLFAAILGFIFLDQMADHLSYIGYVIIIGMAVLKWWDAAKHHEFDSKEVKSGTA